MLNLPRALLIAAACVAGCLQAYAQNGIVRGRVIDEAGKPLEWVTVALITADSTVVSGATSTASGEYEMTAPQDAYTLLVSLMGFKQYTNALTVTEGDNQVPEICLIQDMQALAAASVTGKMKMIETIMGKVVMNISLSPYAQGSDAMELLSKAPGVFVGDDGKVMLNGNPATIYVDGRPTYLDGQSLDALLHSTDGSSIEKIELMEHPSARYDAGNTGAIINIRTKRNFPEGLSGTLGLGGGAMPYKEIGLTPWQESTKLNLNYRTKKANSYLYLYQKTGNDATRIINSLTMPSNDFLQERNSLQLKSTDNFNARAGSDIFLDEHNIIGFTANVSRVQKNYSTEEGHVRQWTGGTLTGDTSSNFDKGPENDIKYTFNLNYTHVLDADRSEELTANIDYHHDDFLSGSIMEESSLWRREVIQDKDYSVYVARLDYQCSLWEKYRIESGAKLTLSRTAENISDTRTGRETTSTDYAYRENISALYASFTGSPVKKFSFNAGLRAEYTDAYKKFLDIFPSAYASWSPDDEWTINASYVKKVSRPSYVQLSPAGKYLDAGTAVFGNPDLKPAYNEALSLNTTIGQHISLAVGYDRETDIIQQVSSFGEGGEQDLIWRNNCSYRSIGITPAITALTLTKWLEWTLFGIVKHVRATSAQTGAERESWVTQGNTNFSFSLGKAWKADLLTTYSSAMDYGSYRCKSRFSTSLTIKKPLLDGRMMLSLNMKDIFLSNGLEIEYLDGAESGNATALKHVLYDRICVLDLSWKFGRSSKAGRSRSADTQEETARLSDGGGF